MEKKRYLMIEGPISINNVFKNHRKERICDVDLNTRRVSYPLVRCSQVANIHIKMKLGFYHL